jgi:Zn-dependent protease
MMDKINLFNLTLMIIPVLLALTGHEFAHAWAAHRLGDDTAKQAGRLTLNPLAHLDLLGTIFLLVSQVFGWAKPVPVNPRNFHRPGRDLALVALAGPGLNIISALALGLILKIVFQAGFFGYAALEVPLFRIFYLIVLVNLVLGIFNLLPLPPLDGFQALAVFLPPSWTLFLADRNYHLIFLIIFVILAYFGVFSRLIGYLSFHLFYAIFS